MGLIVSQWHYLWAISQRHFNSSNIQKKFGKAVNRPNLFTKFAYNITNEDETTDLRTFST